MKDSEPATAAEDTEAPDDPSSEQPYLLSETRLTSIDDDAFEHTGHVDTLEDIIREVELPWHIGLYGTWGSGKSTIISLLYQRIRASQRETQGDYQAMDGLADTTTRRAFENTLCVSIDAWKHAEESVRTELVLDINRALAEALDNRFEPSGAADQTPTDTIRSRIVAKTLNLGGSVSGKLPEWPGGSTSTADQPPVPVAPMDARGVLETDEIIRRLYDVEELQDEHRNWRPTELLRHVHWPTLAAASLLIISILAILVQLNAVGQGLASALGLTGIVLSVLLSAASGVISNELYDASREVRHTFANPKEDWSGAYEALFDEIIRETDRRYRQLQAEANDHAAGLDRIVITIDDIDRCENETAYEILVALKSFLANERCVYIVPCDKDALLKHLDAVDEGEYLGEARNQQNFLAKLFDTELEIPDPLPELRSEYLSDVLDELRHNLNDRPAESSSSDDSGGQTVKEVLEAAKLKTPRRINRVLNRLIVLTELATNRPGTALTEAETPTAREVSPTKTGESTDQDWQMSFLAVIAVLQEDFPRFYAAIERDPYQLKELYDGVHTGFADTGYEGLTGRLDTIGVPDERRESLIQFLLATVETGIMVDNPEPYLRLGGSSRTTLVTFEERLRTGQVDALENLLRAEMRPIADAKTMPEEPPEGDEESPEEDDMAAFEEAETASEYESFRQPAEFVQVIRGQLLEQTTRHEAIRATIEIAGLFPVSARQDIGAALVELFSQQDTSGWSVVDEALVTLSADDIEPLLENLESQQDVNIFMAQYVRSTIDEGGIRKPDLDDVMSKFGMQITGPDVQGAFEQALIDARRDGRLSRSDYETSLRLLKAEYPQLYTPTLIKER